MIADSTVGVTTQCEVRITEEEMQIICVTVISRLSKITFLMTPVAQF